MSERAGNRPFLLLILTAVNSPQIVFLLEGNCNLRCASMAAAAKRMYKLSKQKSPKPMNAVGFKYRLFCTLAKILPAGLSNWVVYKMYAAK